MLCDISLLFAEEGMQHHSQCFEKDRTSAWRYHNLMCDASLQLLPSKIGKVPADVTCPAKSGSGTTAGRRKGCSCSGVCSAMSMAAEEAVPKSSVVPQAES